MENPIQTDPNVLEPIYNHFDYLKRYLLELRGSCIEDAASVGTLWGEDFLGFVMGYRVEEQTPAAERFPFLTKEENLSLTRYRHLKPVQVWPQPIIGVLFGDEGAGVITETHRVDVMLKDIGNAQVWFGGEVGVLWEGYIAKGLRSNSVMVALWHKLEQYLAAQSVKRILTYARDPEFDERWYRDFLAGLGYRYDPGRAHLKAGKVAVMKTL